MSYFFDDRRPARRISIRILMLLDFFRGVISLENAQKNMHTVGIRPKVHALLTTAAPRVALAAVS